MKPKISVIVPVYNVAPYIQRCVRSLCNQTYPNYELIFVDDASPDDSIKIIYEELAHYQDVAKKVKILRHRTNSGLGAARNSGLSMAQGEWCVFVDSDDWVSSVFLENLYSENLLRGDVAIGGVCYESIDATNSKRLVFPPSKIELSRIRETELALAVKYSLACGRLYDLKLIQGTGLRFENITPHEDTLFFMRYLTVASRIVFCDSCDYHYIQYNCNSLSKRTRSPLEYLHISQFLLQAWDYIFVSEPHLRPDCLRDVIQMFGLRQLLQAVRSQYLCGPYSRSERLDVISAVKSYRNHFVRYYKPTKLLNGMFELAVVYLPSSILDCVLLCVSQFIKRFRKVLI